MAPVEGIGEKDRDRGLFPVAEGGPQGDIPSRSLLADTRQETEQETEIDIAEGLQAEG